MAKYLDNTGLAYFWDKIKAHVDDSVSTSANKPLENNKWVMIGDSYGRGTGSNTGWMDQMASILDLTEDEDWFPMGVGGAGFNTNLTYTFGSMATSLAGSMTSDQKNSITKVLVCGGANERGVAADSLIPMIVSQINTIKGLFPNAQICIAMIAGCIDNSFAPAQAPRILQSYKTAAVNTGSRFLDNVQYALHDRTNLNSDLVHPTADGYIKIAKALYAAFNGGYSYSFTKTTQLITPETGWSNVGDSGVYTTDICNDVATFTLTVPISIDSSSTTANFSYNNAVPIGTLAGDEITGTSSSYYNFNRFYKDVTVTIVYNSIIKNIHCELYLLDDRKLYLKNVDTELSGTTSGIASVNRFIVPRFSLTIPSIAC